MLGQVKVERKKSIQLFTENMTKKLFVSIMEKYLKEMEAKTENFELIWDNDLKYTSNLKKKV